MTTQTMTLRKEFSIPDTQLAKDITEFVRENTTPLLFNHSSRVYCFADIFGQQLKMKFDPELLYAGAMFHDVGLMPKHASSNRRFEVDSANTARDFLKSRGISTQDLNTVWTAIALHTTPGIPRHMHPVIALVNAGVAMDVVGTGYREIDDKQREDVVKAFPRTPHFKEDIIQRFHLQRIYFLSPRLSS